MGVRTRIVLDGGSRENAAMLAAGAFARIAEIEDALSDYRPDSEVMRLCRSAPRTPRPISRDLYEVLRLSTELSRVSGGSFDVTVGPLTQLWRKSLQSRSLPTPQELTAARELVGHELVTLGPSGSPEVTLGKAGMRIDFGGIGKGYAAQGAVDWLRSRGGSRCLVALGGDIAVGEAPNGTTGWVIDVPSRDGKSGPTVTLSNSAISTSGDREQFVEIDGRRYSHIIDPRTGLGLTSSHLVTVVASRGELADALATLACAAEPDARERVFRQYPEARIVSAEPVQASTEADPPHRARRGPAPIAR